MNFTQSFKLALNSLRTSKMRPSSLCWAASSA
jgi:hypothetical protein